MNAILMTKPRFLSQATELFDGTESKFHSSFENNC